jgi:glyoxylase-like metal-dependent hydrolase (beta-lactamase superfamily II)
MFESPRTLITLLLGITVFEHGWLSLDNILIKGRHSAALVDHGYGLHAVQTLSLVVSSLEGQSLDLLLNTHLHSDHCDGNAALQWAYPALVTYISSDLSVHVYDWDSQARTFRPTGQTCLLFKFDAVLQAGGELLLGNQRWQVRAAPGHDPHSVVLFEPERQLLISADALWERGFGVVFPELQGLVALMEVGQTIDVIEALKPALVIPGHGPAFSKVDQSIANARARLGSFVTQSEKYIQYATKMLLKFKLLEVQNLNLASFIAWARATPSVTMIHTPHFAALDFAAWLNELVSDLVRVGAACRDGPTIYNAD